MTAGGRRTRAQRWYGRLLFVYPKRYRARFGDAMRDTFGRDHARVREEGLIRLLLFWIATVRQALWFGASERIRPSIGAAVNAASMARADRTRWLVASDLRYAVRLLLRSPLFTFTSVVSLAIGIAASSTIFGLADALLLQTSQGVREPDRVVDIERTTNGSGFGTMSYPVFRYIREHAQTLESMAATATEPAPLSMSLAGREDDTLSSSTGATTERVFGGLVSGTYFDVLKVRPALGRFFNVEEDATPGTHPVVVISHQLWQDRFGADPNMLERRLRLNNREFAVIGVAERGFTGTTIVGVDLWVPIAMIGTIRGENAVDRLTNPRQTWHKAVGRLRPGISHEAAHAELNALFDAYRSETGAVPKSHNLRVVPGGRLPPAARLPFGTFIGVLFAFAAGLLGIACSNVAGMFLARATVRRREMATRLAVGAARGQLMMQMLAEVLVLFVVAGCVAMLLTGWMVAGLKAFLPIVPIPLNLDFHVTGRMLMFTAGVSMAMGLLFGLAPARHSLKADVSQLLQGHLFGATRERLRVRHGLVIAQVALSLAIVITAGLFVRSLRAASDIDSGYRTENVEIVSVDTTLAGATGQRAVALMEQVVERIRSVPGVETVGHGRMIPLQGGGFALGGVRVPGLDEATAARLSDTGWDVVSPDYFRAVGLPILTGRPFDGRDRDGQPRVAIVSETFARLAWPDRPAIGQRFWQIQSREDAPQPVEVIGVVKDAKNRTIAEGFRPFVYVSFAQQPQTQVELFVRHQPGVAVGNAVRGAINNVERSLPVVLIQPFDDASALGLLPQRLAAWIAGIVGAVGIFLAALGLYGLAAFLVAQREREIAIRIALGASHTAVRSMVLGEAARLGAAGTAVGALLAWGLGRVIQSLSLLVGVHAGDPLTFAAVSVLMGIVLFAASYLPARRAASTDPAVALRAQ
jgi:predicted permease